MVLYINSCVRTESRTDRIARALLQKLGGPVTELKLNDMNLRPLDSAALRHRQCCIENGELSDPSFDLARQFAQADIIVISAPFWDYSFPALLKTYLELIYVTGVVSQYSSHGIPEGLCKARKLYYVTTAGGPYDPRFSYDLLEALCKKAFGIPETELISAEMLDVVGFEPEQIVSDTISRLLQ